MSKQLTKAELLKPRLSTLEVNGGTITVRQVTAGYAITLRGRNLGEAEIFDLLAHAIAEPELTPAEIAEMPIEYLQPILNAVLELNALSDGKAEADLKKTQPSDLHMP